MISELNTPLVYIIDDNEALCASLSSHLGIYGYEAMTINSAEEFLVKYSKTAPSCIIIDMDLPEIGGLGLQAEIIKRNITSPIILMSHNSDFEQVAKGFRCGAIDFIQKPIDVEELVVKLEESIQKNISMIDCCNEYNHYMDMLDLLTNREKEIINLLSEGQANKKIAKLLDISFRTVETHISHIIIKTKSTIPELAIKVAQSKMFIKLNPQYI